MIEMYVSWSQNELLVHYCYIAAKNLEVFVLVKDVFSSSESIVTTLLHDL